MQLRYAAAQKSLDNPHVLDLFSFMGAQGPLLTTSYITRTVSVSFTIISPVPKI